MSIQPERIIQTGEFLSVASEDKRRRLYARARLSHARMYLRDLLNGANFDRMVGQGGERLAGATPEHWAAIIVRICAESGELYPEEAAEILDKLRPFLKPDFKEGPQGH